MAQDALMALMVGRLTANECTVGDEGHGEQARRALCLMQT